MSLFNIFLLVLIILKNISLNGVQGNCTNLHTVLPAIATWATNYSGTLYTANISKVAGNISWSIGTIEINNHPSNSCLHSASSSSMFGTNCHSDERFIYPSVNVTNLLSLFNRSISLSLSGEVCFQLEILVKDCPASIGSGIQISHTSRNYRAVGNVSCNNSGTELYFSNGTKPTTTTTFCRYDAMWENQQAFQCWGAPTPTIISNSSPPWTFLKGSLIQLFCSYRSVIPYGNQTIYYIGQTGYVVQRGVNFSIKAKEDFDVKFVSCQAVCPYTLLNNATGRSQQFPLSITFAPQSVPVTCLWTLGENSSCEVRYSVNPQQCNTTFTKNGTAVNNEATTVTTNNKTQLTFTFLRTKVSYNDGGNYSLNVTCTTGSLKVPVHISVKNSTSLSTSEYEGSSPLTTPGTSTTAGPSLGGIIGGCVSAVSAVIVVVGIAIYQHRKRCKPANMSQRALPQINNSMQDEQNYIEVENKKRPVHKKKPDRPLTDYDNLQDNVNVKFVEGGYVELEATSPQTYENGHLPENEYEAPMYESLDPSTLRN